MFKQNGFKHGERVRVTWRPYSMDSLVQYRLGTVEYVERYEELRDEDEVTVRLDSPFLTEADDTLPEEDRRYWYAWVDELERITVEEV